MGKALTVKQRRKKAQTKERKEAILAGFYGGGDSFNDNKQARASSQFLFLACPFLRKANCS